MFITSTIFIKGALLSCVEMRVFKRSINIELYIWFIAVAAKGKLIKNKKITNWECSFVPFFLVPKKVLFLKNHTLPPPWLKSCDRPWFIEQNKKFIASIWTDFTTSVIHKNSDCKHFRFLSSNIPFRLKFVILNVV